MAKAFANRRIPQTPTARAWTLVLIVLAALGMTVVIFVGTIGNQPADYTGAIERNADGTVCANRTDYDQYPLLAESLLRGETALDLEVSETLASLENPYDPDAREAAIKADPSSFYYFDHAFYDGKYYCYFGVAPAVLFFAPFELVTGTRLSTAWLVIFLCCLFAGLLPFLTDACAKRFFANRVPAALTVIATIDLFLGSNVLLDAFFPAFYSVPQAASLAFTAGGLLCWMLASRDEESISTPLLATGSILIALNLGARPQFLIAGILAFPLFWGHIKRRLLFSRSTPAPSLWAILPFLLIGTAVGCYNVIRFGSPFDFGASYNLTGFDMTTYQQSWALTPRLLYTYLFAPPHLTSIFPFLNPVIMYVPADCTAAVENLVCGFFFLSPLMLAVFVGPFVWRILKEHEALAFSLCLVAGGLLVLIFDYRSTGVLWRYFGDFGWMLSLAAVLVLFALSEKVRSKSTRGVFYGFCCVCLALSACLWFFGLLSPQINVLETNLSTANPSFYASLAAFFS